MPLSVTAWWTPVPPMLDIQKPSERALAYALLSGIATAFFSHADGGLTLLVTIGTYIGVRLFLAFRS